MLVPGEDSVLSMHYPGLPPLLAPHPCVRCVRLLTVAVTHRGPRGLCSEWQNDVGAGRGDGLGLEKSSFNLGFHSYQMQDSF